jgi:hypothetical protein
MSTSAATKMTWAVRFTPVTKGRKTLGVYQESPVPVEKGRIPRVSRLMALAIKFEGMIREGVVKDYAELARLGRVTRARISQIMSLICLAPDIQVAVLFLPRIERGREPIRMRDLLPVAVLASWVDQRQVWRKLASLKTHLRTCRF